MPMNEENDNFYSCVGEIDPNSIQIPIVGYEIMEERARFTVCFFLNAIVIIIMFCHIKTACIFNTAILLKTSRRLSIK